MATPFKLKSGNASSFKNLGSSPAKEVIPTSSQMPVNWNKGTTPGYSSTSQAKTQNFRNEAKKVKTVSSKTNVGNKVVNAKNTATNPTKEALKNSKTVKSNTKGFDKWMKTVANKSKKVLNHPTTKKIIKGAGKIGGAVFNIMPAPLVNPTGESYNKNQEG